MKKSFSKKKHVDGETSLNISAMASIFVVILVFLLKSLSTNVAAVTPTQDLTLPEVKDAPDVEDALKLEVSADAISIDDQTVLKLSKFEFDSRELNEAGGFKSVSKAIEEDKKNHSTGENPNELSAVIIADQKTPYSTLKRIIASTSEQGYTHLKLMVVKEQ